MPHTRRNYDNLINLMQRFADLCRTCARKCAEQKDHRVSSVLEMQFKRNMRDRRLVFIAAKSRIVRDTGLGRDRKETLLAQLNEAYQFTGSEKVGDQQAFAHEADTMQRMYRLVDRELKSSSLCVKGKVQ